MERNNIGGVVLFPIVTLLLTECIFKLLEDSISGNVGGDFCCFPLQLPLHPLNSTPEVRGTHGTICSVGEGESQLEIGGICVHGSHGSLH